MCVIHLSPASKRHDAVNLLHASGARTLRGRLTGTMENNTMNDLHALSHAIVPVEGGGEVLVLETGALINPESQAMLGALHSRSIGGIRSHLEVLAKRGPNNFMANFYVGYGHKSIGDNGSISVFIEGVSMLAAKAVQDFRLYNGQESSTRYIDFAEQPFIDPIGSEESKSIQEDWRSFYLHGLTALMPYLKEKYPLEEGDTPAKYEKAISARAFDIMRAFLPAGASTNLVWHGPLRSMFDRLPVLRTHPLEEVRRVGRALDQALRSIYPSSFNDTPSADDVEKYQKYLDRKAVAEEYLTQTNEAIAYLDLKECPPFAVTRNTLDHALLAEYQDALSSRPMKSELPKALEETGELQFTYLLDFGSFRDIQRHRSPVQRMPLLTTRFGFHSWYLEEMSPGLREEAETFIATQRARIDALEAAPEVKQYYIAMGFLTANRLTGTLPGLVYLAELRSGSTVHPTLRVLAQDMATAIEAAVAPHTLTLYIDREPTRFDVRRGDHDIVLKD